MNEQEIITLIGELISTNAIGLYPQRVENGSDCIVCPSCGRRTNVMGYACGMQALEDGEHDSDCQLLALVDAIKNSAPDLRRTHYEKQFMVTFTDEQREALKALGVFVKQEVRPYAAEWDRRQETPWPIIKKAHKQDWYSLPFFAAMFLDPVFGAACVEKLFWGDAGIALSILGTGLAASAIMTGGTDEQKGIWLPRCFEKNGEPVLAAYCVTEEGAGSDVGGIRTKARREGDSWVLNGRKIFITNGGIADVYVVVASVDPDLGVRGHATFIVTADTPGVSVGQKFDKHGIRASQTTEMLFDNVRIPAENLLGGQKKLDYRLTKARAQQSVGEQPTMKTFEFTRILVAAQALGVAQASYEEAVEHAKTRVQFGRPIGANQSIAFKLAEMKARIDSARLMVMRAATMAKNGEPFTEAEGSQAKWQAGEMVLWVTQQARQIFGGSGFITETPVERMMRDAQIFSTYEGTTEMQLSVIARAITGIRV